MNLPKIGVVIKFYNKSLNMKILIIGTGMYVTGRNTDGYGTIFPSIIEFQRNNNLKNLEVNVIGIQ